MGKTDKKVISLYYTKRLSLSEFQDVGSGGGRIAERWRDCQRRRKDDVQRSRGEIEKDLRRTIGNNKQESVNENIKVLDNDSGIRLGNLRLL